jgi:uncharacterized protein with HEPN domain
VSPDHPGRAPRDWRLFLDDIIEACDRVSSYTAGLTLDVLLADRRTYEAVLFNLHVIGEAAGRLPEHVRAQAPELPWREIVGTRNRIAHGYFQIDDRVLWDIVTTEIDPLRRAVARLRETISPDEQATRPTP